MMTAKPYWPIISAFFLLQGCMHETPEMSDGEAAAQVELRMNAIAAFQPRPPIPFYVDKKYGVLAINAAEYPDQFAAAEATFPHPSGTYAIAITTLTEIDGESSYRLYINDDLSGEVQNPEGEDWQETTLTFGTFALENGDQIQIKANAHSNGKIPEGDAFAFARGRWKELIFTAQ